MVKETKSNLTIKASKDNILDDDKSKSKSKVKPKKEEISTTVETTAKVNKTKTKATDTKSGGSINNKVKELSTDNKELSTDDKVLSTDNKDSSTDKVGGSNKKKKVSKKLAKLENDQDEHDEILVNGKRVRSFKVKLPNSENFEGRFTGLTPYQAANKALSKYFREGSNDPLSEITFSICESTRKSKKSTYTYTGRRLQLEVPVKYTIQDGREIVKNFKNSLKKVKKTEIKN